MARITESTNLLSAPQWAGDYMNREHMIPGGGRVDAAQWATVTYTVKLAATAAAAAVALVTDALPIAIPAGTTLDFAGAGGFALTTVLAAAGATSITVEALDAEILNDAEAPFVVTDPVPVTIASGTLIGRTHTERLAGTNFGPADSADDEFYVVCFAVYDAAINPDVELYRPPSVVKENFLPEWASLSAGMKTKLRATYQCVTGQA
jgi:hypothetical protein